MKRIPFGKYINTSVCGEAVKSYIPDTLPPNPPIETKDLSPLLDKANIAIGRLDGISINVPNISLFLYMYIRKEAVFSSQIEGTQSTLSDLLMYENHEEIKVPLDDVIEVSNYVAAMEYGLEKISNNFPLCMRLVKEMHEILLKKVRGSTKQPGEIRKSQNWIGGTRPGNANFVPPPWEKIDGLLSNLEKFLHDDSGVITPTLIKAGLVHLQFETIHPFLDRNGRLGRLLITFILCVDGILDKPLLYLSLFFKTNKQEYYKHLQYARESGDLEEWLKFFLDGIIYTANKAVTTIQFISKLFDEDQAKIKNLGKAGASPIIIHEYLKKHPISDCKKIEEKTNLKAPTINAAIKNLIKLGIVKEITGKLRNKVYIYDKYLECLNDGI